MQVSNCNDIKIYNLSAGKSLPEWLSDRKKRQLQKKDPDVRRRIQLIQDFEMPDLSTGIKVSRDGHYIMATGIYKPRVRCFDVNQLSMKFERCLDAEIVQFEVLSDDYSKMVFLQCDRYVEFHVAYGKYYQLRIPKFGRDMAYHSPTCDMYFVGASSEIWRLNLEQGRFLNSLQSEASSINTCTVNRLYDFIVCGTEEGKVEAWDPRTRNRLAVLDCALGSIVEDTQFKGMPSVTSLTFKDGLIMGVGTATGQILLYDIRMQKPFQVKDHMYEMPIKSIAFHPSMNLVASMDSKIVKFWNENSGKAFTSIQPPVDLNAMCIYPDSGMLFLANEGRKILSYFIPALGTAPKWCSFLEHLAEELEESTGETVYDDYPFVTKKELEDLGLTGLIGTNLLRAYMHGYFINARLYYKALQASKTVDPKELKRKLIKNKIESDRPNRVKANKLPNVNKDLAAKILETESDTKSTLLMQDTRFKALFENPDFQIDEEDEEYKLMKPLVNKLDKAASKKNQKVTKQLEDSGLLQQFEEIEDEAEIKLSSESDETEESSDDDETWREAMKQRSRKAKQKEEDSKAQLKPRFYEIKSGDQILNPEGVAMQRKLHKASLGERLAQFDDDQMGGETSNVGDRIMTFSLKKSEREKKKDEETKLHVEERKRLSRPAKGIGSKSKGMRGRFFRR